MVVLKYLGLDVLPLFASFFFTLFLGIEVGGVNVPCFFFPVQIKLTMCVCHYISDLREILPRNCFIVYPCLLLIIPQVNHIFIYVYISFYM